MRITGDIVIDPGVTLVILPGTKVLFAAGSDDQHTGVEVIEYYEGKLDPSSTLDYSQSHISIDVHSGGKIIARGTLENPITFTSGNSKPNYADWEQIYYTGIVALQPIYPLGILSVCYLNRGNNLQFCFIAGACKDGRGPRVQQ